MKLLKNIWHSRAIWPFRQETGKVLLNFWVAAISLLLVAAEYWLATKLYGQETKLFGIVPMSYLAQGAVFVTIIRFLWSLLRRN
jgi:hypothetical protein